MGNVLGSALDSLADVIGDKVKDAFDSFIESTGLGGIKAVMDAVGRIPELVDPQGAFSPPLEEKMGPQTLVEFKSNPAALISLMIPFIGTLAHIIFTGQVERVQQASRGDHNSGLMAVADLAALAQRDLVTRTEVDDAGYRSGLNQDQINQFYLT